MADNTPGRPALRAAKRRWPQLGVAGMIGFAISFCLLFDIVLEIFWVRTGVYVLPSAPTNISLFDSHYYKFPLTEWVFGSAWFALLACVRYFRNDKGESVAERGIDQIRATPAQKTGLRLLAIIGSPTPLPCSATACPPTL